MHNLSIARRLAGTARRFLRADNGNIAVIFVIALLPILEIVAHQITLMTTGPSGGPGTSALAAAALGST